MYVCVNIWTLHINPEPPAPLSERKICQNTWGFSSATTWSWEPSLLARCAISKASAPCEARQLWPSAMLEKQQKTSSFKVHRNRNKAKCMRLGKYVCFSAFVQFDPTWHLLFVLDGKPNLSQSIQIRLMVGWCDTYLYELVRMAPHWQFDFYPKTYK